MPRRPGSQAYWLIAKSGDDPTELLTLDCDGAETLPVFSFEEEAGMFLQFGDLGDDWRATAIGAGELVSMLHGPYADIREVALDPLPEMVAERTVRLVSLPRERFIRRVTTGTSSNGTAFG